MKILTTFFFLLLATASKSQELTADVNTLLLLHFNNIVNGAAGETPLSSSNIAYDVGRFGQALKCNANTVLKFDTTQNINTKQGTIEFWLKPEVGLISSSLLDMRTTNGFFIEIGYYTSMYINTLPANPNPQLSVSATGNSAYWPGKWYHLAFTWGDGFLKMYVDGKLFGTTVCNFELSPVPLTQFSIGSSLNNNNQYIGLLDEFRISNVSRSSGEICQDYLKGSGTIQTIDVSPSSITMYKGWNVYFNKQGSYQNPKVIGRNGTDSTILSGGCINWSVSNPSVLEIDYSTLTLKAIGGGSCNLIGTTGGKTFSIPVTVKLPVLPEERIQVIDPYLAQPASCYTKLIPTVAYIYLPTLDGVNIDVNEVSNVPQTIALVKQRTLETLKFTKFSLEEGSKFRGYQNPNAIPYVGYQIIEYVFVYEPIPRGFNNPDGRWYSDVNQIIQRFNGKKLVDTLGVREVWLMGYDIGEIASPESNMSSPFTGDISNSYRFPDDLPIYNNTYIVYNYNMQRGGNEAVHNHGHQFESMSSYIATKQDGNADMFWKNFVGRSGANYVNPPLGRCGDTHHPPNTIADYDYCNSTLVASDIFDWKPAGGTTTMVNCNTWSSLPYQWPAGVQHDANSNWFILWMQSFPGNGNQIPNGIKWMTNWWRFISDWNANSINIGLYQNNQEANQGCTAALNSSLPVTSVCSGSSFSVNYYSNGVAFNAGNIFIVQLSDATGSFTNPVNIGTLNSTFANGSINVTVPTNVSSGNSYLIRVNSSNPVITGSGISLLSIKSLPPTATISAGSVITFCTGGSVTLTSNTASGNQWFKDGVAINSATNTTLNATTSGSYTTKVTANTCQSLASNAIIITVNPIPTTPAITAGSAITFCTGGNVTLTSNAASGNQWYKDGVVINGLTATTMNVTASGSYTVKVTLNSCESAVSNALLVTVNPVPAIPTITPIGNQLSSSAVSGNQWALNGTPINGATNQQYTVQAAGLYTVQVTLNGCSANSAVFNFIATAIADPSAWNYDVVVFPNPVNETLYIINHSNRKLDIRLTDITGKIALQYNLNITNGSVNLGKLAGGIYLVSITDKQKNETIHQLIIKQ